jgi:hypothetical protein
MTMIDTTKSDCLIDLDVSYGRYGSQRLSQAITEKEQYLGRRMTRDEILAEYREIDAELCRICLTRQKPL